MLYFIIQFVLDYKIIYIIVIIERHNRNVSPENHEKHVKGQNKKLKLYSKAN
jgi:hypothetical protein